MSMRRLPSSPHWNHFQFFPASSTLVSSCVAVLLEVKTTHSSAVLTLALFQGCFVLLTRGWGKLETRPPVALGSSPELSAFTMSLASPVQPSPTLLTFFLDAHRKLVGRSVLKMLWNPFLNPSFNAMCFWWGGIPLILRLVIILSSSWHDDDRPIFCAFLDFVIAQLTLITIKNQKQNFFLHP